MARVFVSLAGEGRGHATRVRALVEMLRGRHEVVLFASHVAHQLPGGEPWLRKDLDEIALLAEERLRPLVLHVTSNGWFTDRLLAFCEDPRRRVPLQLLLSIDGLEETHNRVRGNRHAWQRVMETVRLLALRQKPLRLSLAVNQTIVDAAGLEQYRMLHEVLRPLGVVHRVVVAYAASATYHQEREIDLPPGAPDSSRRLDSWTAERCGRSSSAPSGISGNFLSCSGSRPGTT